MTGATLENAARLVVFAFWCALSLVILLRRRRAKQAATKRSAAARLGMALQGLAIAGTWSAHAGAFFVPALGSAGQTVASVTAVVLATSSVWLILEAVRVLGEQWSIEARLIEGHRLIVAGPYSHVRNPIYTGMLGMLVATGLVFSVWWYLLPAVAVFAAGTAIRVHEEEKLLSGAFGEDFEAYKNHVPAIIPRWRTQQD